MGGEAVTVVEMVEPRVAHYPEASSSAGREAIDLAAEAGLFLDGWQQMVLDRALGEADDGRWAAFEVGLNLPRQNGKNAILVARELAGLFLLEEDLIIHSAHEFATSGEAQLRIEGLIQNTPAFHRRVKAYKHAHGEEGIYLRDGRRLLFRTRTKGGGRGFSADCVVFDEAMILPEATIGALFPTLSARPNPQVWYTGSAVDQHVHQHGVVLTRLRERGHTGVDDSLAYFEWSVEGDDPSAVSDEVARDPDAWAAANPAIDVRITRDHVEKERRSMDPRTFAVERLGVGDWPDTSVDGSAVIDLVRWRSLVDPESRIDGRPVFAFDVTPDRSAASICAAGRRDDGLLHVEVIDCHPGTGWVAPRLAELRARHTPSAVVCDGASPAASLVDDVAGAVELVGTPEYARACGVIFDAVEQDRLRHRGHPELEAAIRGAAKRPLTDAWAWSRKTSAVDISPLVAATLAVWWESQHKPSGYVF